ncbi:trehalose-phosphatase [Candidatus Deferrimicrobium sp.]|uniref:trehalose-phosphatase n=1 Tax=Candidatus Deferrimicrobium sp. TaxID=3060586 RepID=UPI002ED8538D
MEGKPAGTNGDDRRSLWVFDFDGTLSPIVADRHAARIHPMCREMLRGLARMPTHFVVVLSSREIEDLAKRVPLPRVILGGASGLEWRLPGGHRIRPGEPFEARREKVRGTLAPLLSRLSHIPGVDVEDKGWSVAIHHRHVLPEVVAMLEPLLKEVEGTPDVRVYRGPSVAEVQFLRNVNKSFGVRTICRIIGLDPSIGRILYAGDDENDAVAMRWVLRKGGIAFSVGSAAHVPGARVVENPVALARAVAALAGIAPDLGKGNA